jgi:hypothetical protein
MANLGDEQLRSSEGTGTLNAEVEEDAELGLVEPDGGGGSWIQADCAMACSPFCFGRPQDAREFLYFLGGRVATIMFLMPS